MKHFFTFLSIICLIGITQKANSQAFTFSASQLEYNENFDGMGAAGTAYVTGWTAIRSAGTGAAGATLSMAANDGSANSGNAYNAGASGSSERAFGTLASGSTVPALGASFVNGTGAVITSVQLDGMNEQWRSGSNSSQNEICKFEYSLDATDLATGTWTAVTDFDLAEVQITSTTAAALDGNQSANKRGISASINGLVWAPGTTLWIRWTDVDNTGSDGMHCIDDFSMAVSTGTFTPDPEPSNYPSAFVAVGNGLDIKTTWADATGTNLPGGYLVLISKTNSFTAPIDGTFVADDLDFSDGKGSKNVAFGQQKYTFAGLDSLTMYYVAIYPYSNTGIYADYKTDGSVPSSSASTAAVNFFYNFNTTDLSPWTQYSVKCDTLMWKIDPHGFGQGSCAKMSGYSGSAVENEDWLISPALNLAFTGDAKLQFYSAFKYTGNPLMVLVSNDYQSGDPNNATWTDLSPQATFSTGDFVYAPSGYIPLGTTGQSNVHIAFKYTCTASAASTWEVDNVTITSNSKNGITPANKALQCKLYPNPASDKAVVDFPAQGSYLLKIYNPQGSLLQIQQAHGNRAELDLSQLSPAVYTLSISGDLQQSLKLLVK